MKKSELKKIIREEIQNTLSRDEIYQKLARGHRYTIPTYGENFRFQGMGPSGDFIFYNGNRTVRLKNITDVKDDRVLWKDED
jgi:hypothetical protein